MSNDSNKPTRTLRDGNIKAAIWKNDDGKGGFFYSVEYVRSYTDGQGDWHDSRSFSGSEILRQKRLAGKAYDAIDELKAADKASQQEAA